METKKKAVCVDLDGVLADYSEGWKGINHIGRVIDGARAFVNALAKKYRIVIFTTRCNPEVNKGIPVELLVSYVEKWLKENEIVFDEVYCGVGKPIAFAYFDDRAISVRIDPNFKNTYGAYDEALKLLDVFEYEEMKNEEKK